MKNNIYREIDISIYLLFFLPPFFSVLFIYLSIYLSISIYFCISISILYIRLFISISLIHCIYKRSREKKVI